MTKIKPIGIGLVGYGRAGRNMHVEELKKRSKKFKIVAVFDIAKARRRLAAEELGIPVYTSLEAMLADENVELVDIASPSPHHAAQAITALKAGKNVFLEKPIALSYAEAKSIIVAEKKSKANIFFRHNRRFEPCFQHIREIIDSGILGEVYEIKLRRKSYQRRDDWQTIIDCGGGQLLNWGPHIIDHSLQLLDAPVAQQVSDLRKVAAVGDAEDHLNIIFTGTNGRRADMCISGGSALSEPVYQVWGKKGALVSHDEKTITLKYLDPKVKLKPRRAKRGSRDVTGGFGSPDNLKWIEKTIKTNPKLKINMISIWDYLYDTLRNGQPFPITTDEALSVMDAVTKAKAGTPFSPKAKAAKKKTKKKQTKKRIQKTQ